MDDSANGIGNSLPLADTFALPDANGHFTGTFLGGNASYYLVDSTHGFFVETDLVNPGSGQVALGYLDPFATIAHNGEQEFSLALLTKARKRAFMQ